MHPRGGGRQQQVRHPQASLVLPPATALNGTNEGRKLQTKPLAIFWNPEFNPVMIDASISLSHDAALGVNAGRWGRREVADGNQPIMFPFNLPLERISVSVDHVRANVTKLTVLNAFINKTIPGTGVHHRLVTSSRRLRPAAWKRRLNSCQTGEKRQGNQCDCQNHFHAGNL